MKNKSLTIQTNSKNVDVEYINNEVIVKIHNDMDLKIEFDNNVMLETKGDFTIATHGELGLLSFGEKICIDSVDSEIHMNSRESKHLRNLPESIEYKEKMKEQQNSNKQIAIMQELQNKTLKQRVFDLEEQLKKIKEKLNENL